MLFNYAKTVKSQHSTLALLLLYVFAASADLDELQYFFAI